MGKDMVGLPTLVSVNGASADVTTGIGGRKDLRPLYSGQRLAAA